MNRPNPDTSVAFPAVPSQTVTVVARHRQLNVYSVTEDELESLYTAGNYKTLDISLFSLSFGVFVTVLITMATVDIGDAKIYAVFWASMIVSAIASIFFFFRAVFAWRSAKRVLKEIKRTDVVAGSSL